MRIGWGVTRSALSVALAVMVLGMAASSASALTPGWECVPTAAGQTVV